LSHRAFGPLATLAGPCTHTQTDVAGDSTYISSKDRYLERVVLAPGIILCESNPRRILVTSAGCVRRGVILRAMRGGSPKVQVSANTAQAAGPQTTAAIHNVFLESASSNVKPCNKAGSKHIQPAFPRHYSVPLMIAALRLAPCALPYRASLPPELKQRGGVGPWLPLSPSQRANVEAKRLRLYNHCPPEPQTLFPHRFSINSQRNGRLTLPLNSIHSLPHFYNHLQHLTIQLSQWLPPTLRVSR